MKKLIYFFCFAFILANLSLGLRIEGQKSNLTSLLKISIANADGSESSNDTCVTVGYYYAHYRSSIKNGSCTNPEGVYCGDAQTCMSASSYTASCTSYACSQSYS